MKNCDFFLKEYAHLYPNGKLLEISEEEKDILFSKKTESIKDLETKLIVAVSYMEFETPSSKRVLSVDLEEVNNGVNLLITEYEREEYPDGYCVGDVLNLELRVGNERSFEDQMSFIINGSYYDENDNKIESLLPENNTAKITYDNEKDMKSFLSLIEIAIKPVLCSSCTRQKLTKVEKNASTNIEAFSYNLQILSNFLHFFLK